MLTLKCNYTLILRRKRNKTLAKGSAKQLGKQNKRLGEDKRKTKRQPKHLRKRNVNRKQRDDTSSRKQNVKGNT